jgi:hypothetical protein
MFFNYSKSLFLTAFVFIVLSSSAKAQSPSEFIELVKKGPVSYVSLDGKKRVSFKKYWLKKLRYFEVEHYLEAPEPAPARGMHNFQYFRGGEIECAMVESPAFQIKTEEGQPVGSSWKVECSNNGIRGVFLNMTVGADGKLYCRYRDHGKIRTDVLEREE